MFTSFSGCYHSDSGCTWSRVCSQHSSKFIPQNLTLIDTLQCLYHLLAYFVTGLGKRDRFRFAHLTQQLGNTGISLAACARLLYSDNFSIPQRNNWFDAQHIAQERLSSANTPTAFDKLQCIQ